MIWVDMIGCTLALPHAPHAPLAVQAAAPLAGLPVQRAAQLALHRSHSVVLSASTLSLNKITSRETTVPATTGAAREGHAARAGLEYAANPWTSLLAADVRGNDEPGASNRLITLNAPSDSDEL